MLLGMATYGICALGISVGLLIPYVKNPYFKLVGAGALFGSGIMARSLSRGESRRFAAAQDVRDVSDFARTQILYQQLTQPQVFLPSGGWTPDYIFDLAELRDTTRYPHVLVVGATGDGKSTLIEWLVDAYTETQKLYISPTRDDFEFLDYETYGCGLRPDGSPVNMNFQQISNILQALLVEVSTRYNMPAQQALDRGFINAVLDEYRLTVKVGSGGDTDGSTVLQLENPINGEPMTYSEAVMMLATIARKRFVRLWLLLQSETVKALEMQGEGDIRESFVRLRLGHFGRDHLRSLISNKLYPQEAITWWDGQRPHTLAMVNDFICRLPNLAQYQQEKSKRLGFTGVQLNSKVKPMALPSAPSLLAQHSPVTAQQTATLIQVDDDSDVWDSPPPSSVPSSSPSNPPENLKTVENTTFQTMDEISDEIGLKKVEILKRLGYKPGESKKWKVEAQSLWETYLSYRAQLR